LFDDAWQMPWVCRGDFTSAQTQPKVAFGALDKEPSRTLRGNLLKNLAETAEKTANFSVLSRST
jgi:hypothetical protein